MKHTILSRIHRVQILVSGIFIYVLGLTCASAQIRINEFQASNLNTLLDPGGNFREWVEIFNSGKETVDLGGYYLSNDPGQPFQHRIETRDVGAGEHALIWINKDLYAPCCIFRFSMDGGLVALFSPGGELIDSLHYGQQYPDVSFGRHAYPDAKSAYFRQPTPGSENAEAWPLNSRASSPVQFSLEGGMHSGARTIELSSGEAGGEIRYTMDGSWPGPNAALYTGPIEISSTTVIRAMLYEDGKLPGPLCTQSYFLDEQSSIPIVSIVSDEEHFFDDMTGIYVVGENGIPGRCMEEPVNWNQDWERPVSFEYFDTEGQQVINQLTGIRMHGGCSRKRKYKSMAIIARNKYGSNNLQYKFFASKDIQDYKAVILRNSGNDAYRSMLRDGFMQSLLAGQMNIDYQAYQPASVFLNGQYMGILNVREKINEHYPASNYAMDSDDIDMLETEEYARSGETVSGYGDHYQELVDFVKQNSLADEANYARVRERMDTDEYLNYFLTEIYVDNGDWPGNNVKFWRPRTESGKWRWVLYDLDYGWGQNPQETPSIEYASGAGRPSILFNALLENTSFKNEFIQRMAVAMHTVFEPGRVSHIYDSLLLQLDGEINRHIARQGRPLEEIFLSDTRNKIPAFTMNRPGEIRDEFMTFFNLSGISGLSVSVNDPRRGFVRAAGLRLPDNFEGSVFRDIPLRLEAIPRTGYVFSHWEGASSSNQSQLLLDAGGDSNIRAVFIAQSPLENIHINEISAANTWGIQDEYLQFDDWIEIYNGGSADVDLAGCFLSDSAGLDKKYMIPYGFSEQTTVAAGGHLLIWCDGESMQGPLHSNFKLSRKGEYISLFQGAGTALVLVDSITYPELEAGLNYGRIRDSSLLGFMRPTPGAANDPGERIKLFINEFMTKNCGVILDEQGEAEDWVELYNPGPGALELGGLFLTDSLDNPLKYLIPAGHPESRLEAGEKLLLWADDQAGQGPFHMNFKLDAKREQIGLYQIGHGYLDSLSYQIGHSGETMGRFPDGAPLFRLLHPTPGEDNRTGFVDGLRINEIMAAKSGDWIEIFNENEFPVDLGGLFITDSLARPDKYRIPMCYPELTTLPPGAYLVLWADGMEDLGPLHLGFKLAAGGEQIGLVQPDGSSFIDSLSYPDQKSNFSYSLRTGGEGWMLMRPTPMEINENEPIRGIVINELMAGNDHLPDDYGEFDDWIELFNGNDFPVDIGGLYLSDSLGDQQQYRIPSHSPEITTIAAGEYLVLFADNTSEQGVLHTNFKLRKKGEALVLSDIDGERIIDSLHFPDQKSNFSYSRLPGTSRWMLMRPTFMAYNENAPLEGIRINELMASNTVIPDDHGDYDDWIEFYNSNDYPVDIGGLFLSDTLGDPARFRIPSHSPDLTTIAPKNYLLLFADNTTGQGALHTNFRLSSAGESIILRDIDASRIIDSISFPEQPTNFSYSREDNEGPWILMRPTPLAFNRNTPVQGIVINEFMTSNTRITDEFGEFDDWIELYNTNAFPVDIGGLFLTDSMGHLTKYRIPSHSPERTTIEPYAYRIIWADDDSDQGLLHTNFKLRSSGEQIALVQYDQESILDSLSYGKQYKNASSGLLGKDRRWYTLPPSPEKRNTIPDYTGLRINEIMGYNRTMHHDEHNEYDDWIELYNAGDKDLDIGGMYLSDSLSDPGKFRISSEFPDSTTIGAGEYLILWADNAEAQGVLHLGFKIAKTGESIGLFNQANTLVDSITYPFISPNLSWGRSYGEDLWTIFTDPTPMQANMPTSAPDHLHDKDKLAIYPNPVRDIAYFTFAQDMPGDVLIEIVNSHGKRCTQVNEYHPGGGVEEFSLNTDNRAAGLNSGLYFLRIYTGDKVLNTKFLLIK